MSSEETERYVAIQLQRAEESFAIAAKLSDEHPTFCVNRYYYTLYYAISALLMEEGITVKTHKGVISEFGRHFVATGKLPIESARLLAQVAQLRTVGDYDVEANFTTAEVRDLHLPIRSLLDEIRAYLGK